MHGATNGLVDLASGKVPVKLVVHAAGEYRSSILFNTYAA